jgi:hypothetical protein
VPGGHQRAGRAAGSRHDKEVALKGKSDFAAIRRDGAVAQPQRIAQRAECGRGLCNNAGGNTARQNGEGATKDL